MTASEVPDPSVVGSSSSGLVGLADRVHAVERAIRYRQPSRRPTVGHRRPPAENQMDAPCVS